jgi:integrase
MPTLKKLTLAAIERLPAPDPSGKQTIYWDAERTGLGVVVSGTTKSKSWVFQKKLPDGRARRVTLGPVGSLDRDAAWRAADDKRADLGVPKRRATAPTTLRAALDAYLTGRKDLRPRTQSGYRKTVERDFASWLDLPLRDISPDAVEARHQTLAAEVARRNLGGRRGGGEANGGATANAAMRVLRLVYNYAAERDPTLPPNPVRRLRRGWYRQDRREGVVRTDDLPAFYRAILGLPSPIARDYLLLVLFTGLRRNEAAALRWDEVDFTDRAIRLPAKRMKAGRRLDLPMSDVVRDLLVARRAIGVERSGFVFPSNSRSGHVEEPKSFLATIAEATGIRVTVHDLRRTYITIAEATDISPLALKALVNHSLGNDVTEGYVRMTVERLRGPAQKVADKLKELCGITPAGGASDNVIAL